MDLQPRGSKKSRRSIRNNSVTTRVREVQAQRDLEESASLLVTNTPEVGVAHIINCHTVIRFVNKTKAQSSKPVGPVGSGSFTSEVLFSESLWILQCQKSLLQKRDFKRQCAQMGVIKDMKDMNGILRNKGKLCLKQRNFPHSCHVIITSRS